MSLNTILATAPLTTTNYILKATGTTIGNSLIWDNGTNVGIGTSSPSGKLHLSTTSDTYFVMTGGATPLTYSWLVDATNLRLFNGVGATTLLTIASTGAATFSSGIGIGGATATTGGIQFPATQVSSANANNLDDYEEGTFTPTVSFSGGGSVIYYLRLGTYTKIGRQVTVNLMVNFSDNTGSGNVSIGNLPFTSNSTTNYRLAGSILGAGMTGLVGGLTVYMGASTTTLDILQTNGGVYSGTFVTNANTSTDTDFSIGITYFTS